VPAPANGVPAGYIDLADEEHGFVKKEDEIHGYTAVIEFLETYLRAEVPREQGVGSREQDEA
jgi:hypothetical protein